MIEKTIEAETTKAIPALAKLTPTDRAVLIEWARGLMGAVVGEVKSQLRETLPLAVREGLQILKQPVNMKPIFGVEFEGNGDGSRSVWDAAERRMR